MPLVPSGPSPASTGQSSSVAQLPCRASTWCVARALVGQLALTEVTPSSSTLIDCRSNWCSPSESCLSSCCQGCLWHSIRGPLLHPRAPASQSGWESLLSLRLLRLERSRVIDAMRLLRWLLKALRMVYDLKFSGFPAPPELRPAPHSHCTPHEPVTLMPLYEASATYQPSSPLSKGQPQHWFGCLIHQSQLRAPWAHLAEAGRHYTVIASAGAAAGTFRICKTQIPSCHPRRKVNSSGWASLSHQTPFWSP